LPNYFYDCFNLESFSYSFLQRKPEEGVIEIKPEGEEFEEPRKDFRNKIILLQKTFSVNSNHPFCLVTRIKKKYYSMPITKEVTPLKTLISLREIYKPDIENIAKLNKNVYRVNCYVYEIYPYSAKESIKKFCKICRKM
jgi:hypothetical protein